MLGNAINRHVRQQVGGFFDQSVHNGGGDFLVGIIANGNTINDGNVVIMAKFFKVFKGTQMYIGGVIPRMGQGVAHGHNALNA